MEKFFRLTKDGSQYLECERWTQEQKDLMEIFSGISKQFGIETTRFSPISTALIIVPTAEDVAKFQSQLTKEWHEGYARSFKKNSAVGKAWKEKISAFGTFHGKPFVPFWFNGCYGRLQTRLFKQDGVWYGSISCAGDDDNEYPEGIEKMLGSEFYQIIEIGRAHV